LKDYIRERVREVANYIYETKATVREAAKIYGVSKSTIHKDVTERLSRIDTNLAKKVKKVLEYNKAERHIRGGEATRKKYKNMK
jgi:putative DeoR family transcriptional regulator (stage III sporulation protein D)